MTRLATLLVTFLAAGPAIADDVPPAADLLFTSARDGNSEIYLQSAAGGEWTNLTRHEASDNWPAWSPDGRRIAFQSKRSGNLDVWVMDADGGALRQLTRHPEPDYLPAWSPDGRRLVFTSWRQEPGDGLRKPHFYVIDADGGNERRLPIGSPAGSSGASWSPDGTSLLFSRQGAPGADLFLARIDGGGERQLTQDAARDVHSGSPRFSPDGGWIAYYADHGNSSDLVLLRVDGGERRVLRAEGRNWYPSWSADGRWITYTVRVPGPADDTDIHALPVAPGSQPLSLVRTPARDLEGSWRPR